MRFSEPAPCGTAGARAPRRVITPFGNTQTLSTILIGLASAMLASGSVETNKLVGEWQSVAPASREPRSKVEKPKIGLLVETYTFKADGTYESVISCNGAFSPIRQKGTYI